MEITEDCEMHISISVIVDDDQLQPFESGKEDDTAIAAANPNSDDRESLSSMLQGVLKLDSNQVPQRPAFPGPNITAAQLNTQRGNLRPVVTRVKNHFSYLQHQNKARNQINADKSGRSALESYIKRRLKNPSFDPWVLQRAVDHYQAHTNKRVNQYGELPLDLALLTFPALVELYTMVRDESSCKKDDPDHHDLSFSDQQQPRFVLKMMPAGTRECEGGGSDRPLLVAAIARGELTTAWYSKASSPSSSSWAEEEIHKVMDSSLASHHHHHSTPSPLFSCGDWTFICKYRRPGEREATVLYDFIPSNLEGDHHHHHDTDTWVNTLEIRAGEKVWIKNTSSSEERGWAYVRNEKGGKGWVPIEYLEDLDW
ncbi:hypothetical protein QBC43DRAFT_355059 [Cladorrhinum sp. PSN259]|nr:hypothetical protein QBC43DRAFT_355059 [Cladorrhinum sp. PSN259]